MRKREDVDIKGTILFIKRGASMLDCYRMYVYDMHVLRIQRVSSIRDCLEYNS